MSCDPQKNVKIIDGLIKLDEFDPTTLDCPIPEANKAYLYASDASGTTTLNIKRSDGSIRTVLLNENETTRLVVVTQASDLAGTLDSSKIYLVDGIIDMGSQAIKVPLGGLDIIGYTFDVSKLTSSETGYTMFISPVGGSGNVLQNDIAIEVTGAGSQVYDLVAAVGVFPAFEINRVNWNNCTSMGVIDGYRQGLEAGTGRFGGTPTLTLEGAWVGGFFIDTSIIRNLDSSMTGSLYSAGENFSMASRFRSNQNLDLPESGSFFDFDGTEFANPSTIQLDGCIITRNGASNADDSNIIPNISKGNLASQWKDNLGIGNTFQGGKQSVATEQGTTTTVQSGYVDLSGVWVSAGLEHFDSPANGQLRHLGTSPREYRIDIDLVVEGPANDVLGIRVLKWDNSSGVFVAGGSQKRQINNFAGGRDVAFFTFPVAETLDQNDYIKLQVNNQSTTSSTVTAELDSFFIVQTR